MTVCGINMLTGDMSESECSCMEEQERVPLRWVGVEVHTPIVGTIDKIVINGDGSQTVLIPSNCLSRGSTVSFEVVEPIANDMVIYYITGPKYDEG